MGKSWTQVLQDRNAGLVPGFAGNDGDVVDDDRELSALSKAELVDLADDRGVEVDPRATKAEIIAALEG